MNIIKFNDHHLEACVDLFIKVFNSPPWNDQWTKQKATELLSNISRIPTFIGFIGVSENKIIAACLGYKKIWWNGEEYYIEEIFVDNNNQREGFGSMLLNSIQKELKEENINAITLLTGHGTPAKMFYEKNEFFLLDNFVFMKKKI